MNWQLKVRTNSSVPDGILISVKSSASSKKSSTSTVNGTISILHLVTSSTHLREIPDGRAAWMRDLPTEEVGGEISGK